MSEVFSETIESTDDVLEPVLTRLQELHLLSANGKPDSQRILDGMNNLFIGKTTIKAQAALIQLETQALHEQAIQEKWSDELLREKIEAMTRKIIADMVQEHLYESTLSTPENPINSAIYGTSMFRYRLRELMTENPTPESFSRFGWIMFDVNGLRSFKDSTSHEYTTQYLQEIVKILIDPNGTTYKYLEALGINVIPMATGGDEFELYLSGTEPLTNEIIQHTVASFQQEITTSERLRSLLDFDDQDVLMAHGVSTEEQRNIFEALPEPDQQKILKEIREALPDTFTPSIAGGGATLNEGVILAADIDPHDLQGEDETFYSVREKIIQHTRALAEKRQKENKKSELEQLKLKYPKEHAFRLRNRENRELEEQNQKLEAVIGAIEKATGVNRADFERLLAG